MATVGNIAFTFSDLRKRLGPSGTIDFIIEVMAQSNPIMEHIPWEEGNLPTGNQTTLRTSYPHPELRRINRGVSSQKSNTRQIVDTCCIMEARSEIDVRLLKMAPDKEGLRRSEDAAFVEGFTDDFAKFAFYGDTDSNPDQFNGLAIRYNTFTGDKGTAGYQTINAGGSTAGKQASIYMVDWGENAVVGIYPRGSKAGLDMQDLGENDATDADGKKFRAVSSLFSWDAGLAVKNLRKVSVIHNVDMSTKPQSTTSTIRKTLLDTIIVAKNRIIKPKNPKMYVPENLFTILELALNDKNNVYVTRQELMDQMPKLYVSGIEVCSCDALSETEAIVE